MVKEVVASETNTVYFRRAFVGVGLKAPVEVWIPAPSWMNRLSEGVVKETRVASACLFTGFRTWTPPTVAVLSVAATYRS